MPLRTRLFIILSIIIAIILAISITLLIVKKKKDAKTSTSTQTEYTGGAGQVNRVNTPTTAADLSGKVTSGVVTVAKPTTQEVQQNAAKQIAKVFAERYGSFSNQNGYQNIKEVQSISTSELYSSISKIMNNKQNESTYYGVSTNVISVVITDWNATKANVKLSAKRVETKNGTTKNINQDATVTVVKSGSNWLVSSFKWQ